MGKIRWAHQLASAGMAALLVVAFGVVFTGFWDDFVADAYTAFHRPPPPTFAEWQVKAVALLAVTIGALMFWRPAIVRWWRARQRNGPLGQVVVSSGRDDDLRAIRTALNSLANTVAAQGETVRNLIADRASWDNQEQLAKIGGEVQQLERSTSALARHRGIARRALALNLQFTLGQTNFIRMGLLIEEAPRPDAELTAEWYLDAQKYLARLRTVDPGGDRRVSLMFHLETAKAYVEADLRTGEAPPAPADISVHDWREWLIAQRQCDSVVHYLKAARKELERRLADDYYSHLSEVYNAIESGKD
jgi:hypothetical protein